VFASDDLGWPSTHLYSGNAAGTAVPVLRNLGRQEMGGVGNPGYDDQGPRRGNTS